MKFLLFLAFLPAAAVSQTLHCDLYCGSTDSSEWRKMYPFEVGNSVIVDLERFRPDNPTRKFRFTYVCPNLLGTIDAQIFGKYGSGKLSEVDSRLVYFPQEEYVGTAFAAGSFNVDSKDREFSVEGPVNSFSVRLDCALTLKR